MIRLAKLTDYGVVLLTHFAAHDGHGEGDGQSGHNHSARELAQITGIPMPTVSKLLKILTHQGLLASHRGLKGGYMLARPPSAITVADIIGALEGPLAVTECSLNDHSACGIEGMCAVRGNWQKLNQAIFGALKQVTLADMAAPLSQAMTIAASAQIATPQGRRSLPLVEQGAPAADKNFATTGSPTTEY